MSADADDAAGRAVEIAVVGAVALDEIHSAAGDVEQQLGGSAVHACLAASLLAHAAPISVIGDDFDPRLLDPLREREISLDGVVQAEGSNFRWGCRYTESGDQRETLYTHAGVYDTHPIVVSEALRDAPILLLTAGNPEQNWRALGQFQGTRLVAIDTIEREVAERTDEFRELLREVDLVSINTLEAAHLIGWRGELDDPALASAAWRTIRELGGRAFALKRASLGVEVFEGEQRAHVGAVPKIRVIDPTGAGDAFIGGLLSAVARGWSLFEAARWGCALASFAVERFGVEGVLQATCETVERRLAQVTLAEAAA